MTKVSYPQITIKVFTKKILKHSSQGVAKLTYEVLMGLISDIVLEYELIVGSRFTLEENEAVFDLDRVNERNTHGNRFANVRLPADAKISFKELSEKSGIPVWKIVDHVLRLMLKYGYFSKSDRQWRKSIREAIKRQSSREDRSNLKKIHVLPAEPVEEIPAVVKPVVGLRPIARDRINLKKGQINRIKLNLISMSTNDAVRFSLDHYPDWYHTNIVELRRFIESVERNNNPVTVEVITRNNHHIRGGILLRNYLERYQKMGDLIPIEKAKECYTLIDAEWNYPDWLIWFERLVSFWTHTHPYRRVKKADLTIKEWFSRYELAVPDVLLEIENRVVLTYTQLKRTGIITDLDLKIKNSLGIENRIEYAYSNFDELDAIGKTEIGILVNSSEGYHHQYAQLLRERLKRDKGSSPHQE